MFDKKTSLAKKSTGHSSPQFESDLDKVIQQLMKIDAFKSKPGRFHNHSQFTPNFKSTHAERCFNQMDARAFQKHNSVIFQQTKAHFNGYLFSEQTSQLHFDIHISQQ